MSYAPRLRAVRATFGLSQAQLAQWLGLSRPLLSLAESGHTPLPAHARLWLAPWLLAQTALETAEAAEGLAAAPLPAPLPTTPPAEPPAEPPALPATAPATAPALVRERWQHCHHQAQRLALAEAALRASSQVATRQLAAAPWLLAALAAPPASVPSAPPHGPDPDPEPAAAALRRRWLTRLLEAATDALLPGQATTGPTGLLLLAARRAAYLHEAAVLAAGT